jgi:hypothetical protein
MFAGVGLVVIEQVAAWALETPSSNIVQMANPCTAVDKNRCAEVIGISPV